MASKPTALQLHWSFGFNDKCGVHSLSTSDRSAIFYATAHTGIIYDYQTKTQLVLQGHCNPISTACVSADKKWIVTADGGADSVIVVWDSTSGTPVKTLFAPHDGGVEAMAISEDAMFIATLGKCEEGGMSQEQEISLWEWTTEVSWSVLMCPLLLN